jgi:L-histidine N-alpha-methyltransferase
MPSATETGPRVRVDVLLDDGDRRAALHDDTFWSLRETPKELPAVWLYDERGSQLFDEITRLPEYYLTHREREILTAHATEIAARTAARTLVELGSGTSDKTRLLLRALDAAGTLERFVPLDASEAILRTSAHALAAEYATLGVHAIVGDFERHLGAIPAGERRLVAFLGSTIGNLTPSRRARFLASVASILGPGDGFLLGVDLVKDPVRLAAAYNDSRGVTESFVRNGLEVANRELGAEFDQERLAFVARWDEESEWMDIGFRATVAHTVPVAELDVAVPLAAGEPLRLEISSKFRREGVEADLAAAGLELQEWWTDGAGDFAVLLARRASQRTPAAR